MSGKSKQKVLEFLKGEPRGAALLLVSKKVGLNPMETRKILEALVEEGVVEKKGRNYKLKDLL